MTDWEKWNEEYRERRRRLIEKASSIKPHKVGRLYFFDRDGVMRTPNGLYFAWGVNGDRPGECFTHYDNALIPVYVFENKERLVKPEWAELCASFKDGIIKDFYLE